MQNLTKIASFNQLAPATALAEELRSHGLEAQVHDETTQQQWQLWNLEPRAHFQVHVRPEDEAQIAGLVRDSIAAGGAASQAVRCPDCGGLRIEYPQFSRKTILGSLPSIMAAAGVIERDYYCQSCHFTWPSEPPKAEPELDVLNWPKKDQSA